MLKSIIDFKSRFIRIKKKSLILIGVPYISGLCFENFCRERHSMHEHIGESDKCYVKVTAALSLGMDGFDILAMGYRYLIHPTHWLNLTKIAFQCTLQRISDYC